MDAAQIAELANVQVGDDDFSSPQPHDSTPGAKRKADDGGPQRAKRNRYISIACNEVSSETTIPRECVANEQA